MIQKTIAMKIAAAVVGTAAIAGTVVAIRHMSEVKDTYRSILLYEIEGTAEIEREGTGKFSGTENLYLESGDQLTVEPESFTRLRLDEDKYVMVEENSAVSIEAAGTVEDSRTKLNLTKGAIINEIRNPLSAGSTYEVTTPNSIMAVRGTIFRVEVSYDENGEIFTKVSVFEGEVSSRLIYPDGTMEEEVLTGNGKEVIIHSNRDLTEYLGEERDIKYEELPPDILRLIQEMMNTKGITEEGVREESKESETIKEARSSEAAESTNQQNSGEATENTNEGKSTEKEKKTKKSGPGEKATAGRVTETMPTEESSTTPETLEETSMAVTETVPSNQEKKEIGPGYDDVDDSDNSGGSSSGGSGGSGGGSSSGGSGGSGGGSSSGGSGSSGGGSSSDGSGSSGGGSGSGGSQTEENTTEAPTETSAENTTEAPTETSAENTTEAPTETSAESTTEAPTESTTEAPTEPAEYTVTFMYNGAVFGTQHVKEGQCAIEPWLNPASTGSWDADFTEPVTGDLTIQWQ